jgi:hypothetical protein
MVQLGRLLDRKHEIVRTIKSKNDEVELNAKAKNKLSRQEYSWILLNMERNNAAVASVLQVPLPMNNSAPRRGLDALRHLRRCAE